MHIACLSQMQLSRLLAKMEGSGRKGKEEKRKLPDGDFNEATITLDAKRTTKDGKADVSVCSYRLLASILVTSLLIATRMGEGLRKEVMRFSICFYSRQGSLFVLIPGSVLCLFLLQAGFVATYYEHPDGTVVEANRVVELSLKRFVDCEHLIDVARVVKDLFRALEHVKDSEMRFQKGEHVMLDVEDFLEHLRGSESTSPVQVFCRAPGGLVADTTPLQRNLYERYREVWTMTATPSNVRRVQCPQDCSEFSELGHFTRPAEERYRLFVPQNLEERYRQFAPSSMTTKKVRRVQLAGSELGPLYKCGRPLDALGLEAPLMHPVFGTFMQNVRNASLPTREDYAFVQEFCLKSSEFYNNERDRQTALKNLLKPYLWRTVDPREINGYEVDGYIGRCTGFPVYSILEFENELGSTSVDKYFHGQRCYAEFCDIARSNTCDSAIFTSCNCPAFLVEFRGAQMRISAMGYFDRVHTSMLTDLVNLSWGNENLPRIFKALKVGIDNLQLFYEEVEDVGRTSTRVNWLEKVVPYPVWWNPRYTFKKSLRTSDLRKHLFLAEDDQKQNVLIKFSNRYGEEVSILLHHFN